MGKKTSRPAFPAVECVRSGDNYSGPSFAYHTGLTVREEFVKAAMQGLLASPRLYRIADFPDLAVEVADRTLTAMYEAEEKKKETAK